METIYKNMGVIVGFLVITFIIQSFGGEKLSTSMLMFVLFSMIILNATKFKNVLDGAFESKEEKRG